MEKVLIGGLPITNLSREGWAACMVEVCQKRISEDMPKVVFSANGQVVAECYRNKEVKALITKADYLDADGQPLVFASKLLTKTPLPERVATTDFFHNAAQAAEEAGLRFYFLGATKENNQIAVNAIQKLYPRLQIVGHRDGYFTQAQEPAIIQHIHTVKTDVLWVGLGVPRQEEFVIRNKQALRGVGWIKTCGGLFDYFNPKTKRAPAWMQKSGLEWLFRMINEPHKYAKRYIITNPIALWVLLTQTRSL
jgi:exopolysaccharide biosynthesis WecB/TagA/CpsF family protein